MTNVCLRHLARSGWWGGLLVAAGLFGLALLLSVSGCPGGDPLLGLQQALTVEFYANTDPADPIICKIVNNADGDWVLVYGQKDESGVATRVDALEYWSRNNISSQPGVLVVFDDQLWPTRVTFGSGSNRYELLLSYDGDQVRIEERRGDEVQSIRTEALPPDSRAKTAAMAKALREMYPPSPKSAARSDVQARYVSLVGQIKLFLKQGRTLRVEEIKSARIWPRVVRVSKAGGYNIEEAEPGFGYVSPNSVTYDASKVGSFGEASVNDVGMYTFNVVHRTEQLSVPAAEAQKTAESVGNAFSVVGIGLSIVGAFAPQWAAKPLGALGAGLGIGSMSASDYGKHARDAVWAAATPDSTARVYVDIWFGQEGSSGWLYRHQMKDVFVAEYNVYQPDDQVLTDGYFAKVIDVQNCDLAQEYYSQLEFGAQSKMDCEMLRTVLAGIWEGCIERDDERFLELCDAIAFVDEIPCFPDLGQSNRERCLHQAEIYYCGIPSECVATGSVAVSFGEKEEKFSGFWEQEVTIINTGPVTLDIRVRVRNYDASDAEDRELGAHMTAISLRVGPGQQVPLYMLYEEYSDGTVRLLKDVFQVGATVYSDECYGEYTQYIWSGDLSILGVEMNDIDSPWPKDVKTREE
ncbi:MAG: hypothetical protein KKB50_13460 [Planctomycetes bacterium]|nr:hypothetical protein [Planctomycetota bacterium]